MKKAFLDTNIFIRYLTNDDPVKADQVDGLLRRAARSQINLYTSEVILAEVVWVLESFYRLDRIQVAEKIRAILHTPGLTVLGRTDMNQVVRDYVEFNVDFVDALMVAIMEKNDIDQVYSYDRKHLSRFKRVSRLEP
ncbi:MAG: PIN domain-containing protein [Desulfonatronovibrio sp.]